MRIAILVLILLIAGDSPRGEKPRPPDSERVDFGKQVKPILEGRCQPCHFPGGTMYAKLPFDQPSTIVTLGERLFTRIKDKKSRAVIRKFLAEQETHAPPR
jgi:hypothetical protein